MPFYAHPTELISPGDVFPDIPVTVSVPPTKILRKSNFNPKAKFGPQDLRRAFTLPDEAKQLGATSIDAPAGEETVAHTRIGLAMFLSWGSQVEADERDVAANGDKGRKRWLAAPIYPLRDIPESAVIEDPDSKERISIREIVRMNASHHYFYLPPFPETADAAGYYVDFRKISSVGMGYFTGARGKRLAALTEESLNLLFSRLMWFFTRAEYFFQPVRCSCGLEVAIDVRFEGQNIGAEAWE